MTEVTVTIPRQAEHSVTAAASELASRAQAGALKSWKNTMSSRLALMAFVVLGASGALADDMKMPMNGKDIKWGPAPPFFPKGAEFAVLSGDPGKDGPYVVRLKMPAGYKIPAHNHPTTENVTVVSGNFHIGMGDYLDEKKGIELTSGGYGGTGENEPLCLGNQPNDCTGSRSRSLCNHLCQSGGRSEHQEIAGSATAAGSRHDGPLVRLGCIHRQLVETPADVGFGSDFGPQRVALGQCTLTGEADWRPTE